MLDLFLIKYCAPILAGMKSASLFTYSYEDKKSLQDEICQINTQLNKKGVFVEILKWNEKNVLIYVYRPLLLEKEWEKDDAQKLLRSLGYIEDKLENLLERLKQRLEEKEDFPHEIGLFLGYPPGDVEGFIRNRGKNYLYCDLWKVYDNEKETRNYFLKVKRCSMIYQKVFFEGRDLLHMTVSA